LVDTTLVSPLAPPSFHRSCWTEPIRCNGSVGSTATYGSTSASGKFVLPRAVDRATRAAHVGLPPSGLSGTRTTEPGRDFGAMRPRVLCAGAGYRARAAGVRVRAPVIRTRSPRTCTVTEAGGSTRRAVRPRHRLSLIHDPDHRPDVTGIHPAVHRHELATRGRQDPGHPHRRIRHEPSASPPSKFWRRRHGCRPAAGSSEPAQ